MLLQKRAKGNVKCCVNIGLPRGEVRLAAAKRVFKRCGIFNTIQKKSFTTSENHLFFLIIYI
jgi:hypothetical protein